ncbi:MAG: hypothetical protein ACLQG3_12790 [Terracidiphilus sp.]
MEISPIPAIHTMGMVKIPAGEGQPLAVLDVDASARPNDDDEQGDRRKAAGAEEDEGESAAAEGETERAAEAPEDLPARQVDYFA